FAVVLDVKPGSPVNPVNLKGKGAVPMAILSAPDFDATAIDPATLSVGDGAGADTPPATRPNGTYQVHAEDVNDDGLEELVVHVRVSELGAGRDLPPASRALVARGVLDDGGTHSLGEHAVRIGP